MQKIISLFKRNYDSDYLVRNEMVEGAEWVLCGEGVATRKYNGTCCLVRNGKLYKRYELRQGKKAPDGFEAATDADLETGKQQGWVPVDEGAEDKYHREAFRGTEADGTYELVGEKIQGNPDKFQGHILIKHSEAEQYQNFPRNFEDIKGILKNMDIEGVVWHHPDGRMVKIKKKDFFRGK